MTREAVGPEAGETRLFGAPRRSTTSTITTASAWLPERIMDITEQPPSGLAAAIPPPLQ